MRLPFESPTMPTPPPLRIPEQEGVPSLTRPAYLRLTPQTRLMAGVIPHTADHLLIVDDDPSVREFLSIYLRRRGYRVWVAATAMEALSMIGHQKPDLLLVDIAMPQMSGVDLVKALRSQIATSLLPIIIISAFGTARDMRNGLAVGADDYVAKPVELGLIEARIKALLRRDARMRVALGASIDPPESSDTIAITDEA